MSEFEIKSMGQFREALEDCPDDLEYCIEYLKQQSQDYGSDGKNIRDLLAVVQRMFNGGM